MELFTIQTNASGDYYFCPNLDQAPVLSQVAFQVLAKPVGWYQHPQPFLTEYLRLGPNGGIGRHGQNPEAGPTGDVSKLYRADRLSQFCSDELARPHGKWRIAEVTFRRRREVVLWNQGWTCSNARATTLLDQPDTFFLYGGRLEPGRGAYGPAYIVRGFLEKFCIDVQTSVSDARSFEQHARPLFSTWWRAIPISGGWRIFGDSNKELIMARLALSK